mgnify:CR=1 FL=1
MIGVFANTSGALTSGVLIWFEFSYLIRVFTAVFEPSKLLKTRIVVSWRLEQSRV